ncbi:PbsX family transcriptional regulator, partial [Escherichia coli]|nr:PbsX family transcriptional regulator [Escherichia coli]
MCNTMTDYIQRNTLTHYRYNVKLAINNISNEHFWLLIELSGIRSDKIIMSLREHLVDGFSKREVCERNGVSLSYFSISLKKISHIHNVCALISKYYNS